MFDVVTLSQELISYPSITPDRTEAIDFISTYLEELGFDCHKFVFDDPIYNAPVCNLYARLGNKGKNLCFAGHTDVVPPGDLKSWSVDPFAGTIINDKLYGRGTVDMKCAIACFIMAMKNTLRKISLKNSISVIITGDEEGHATNGTAKLLHNLNQFNEKIDLCIIGEPSNPSFLGEMIKIGRRGSLNATLEIYGTQGHVAYPEYAHNPINDFITAFNALKGTLLDQGNTRFQPSNLEFTSIKVDNNTCNIIPQKVTSKFNVRFNDNYNSFKLIETIRQRLDSLQINYQLMTEPASEPFVNHPLNLCNNIVAAIKQVTGKAASLGTSGGTSDARFIQQFCPVVEFGLVAKTAHQMDEHVLIQDLYSLQEIYAKIIQLHLI